MMHNHPQDVGVTHWKPGSGIFITPMSHGSSSQSGILTVRSTM